MSVPLFGQNSVAKNGGKFNWTLFLTTGPTLEGHELSIRILNYFKEKGTVISVVTEPTDTCHTTFLFVTLIYSVKCLFVDGHCYTSSESWLLGENNCMISF